MLFSVEKLSKNHLSEAELILVFQCLSGREAETNTDYEVLQNDDQAKLN